MKDSHTNNPLDMKVREKLQGMEVTPPPGVWEGLEAGLNAQQAPVGKKRYALLLLIPLLAVLGSGIYYWQSGSPLTDDEIPVIDQTLVAPGSSAKNSSSAGTEDYASAAVTGNTESGETINTTALNATAALDNNAQPGNLGTNTISGRSGSNVVSSNMHDANLNATVNGTKANNSTFVTPNSGNSLDPGLAEDQLISTEAILSKLPTIMIPLNLKVNNELDEEYPDERESVLSPHKYRPRLGWSVEIAFTPAMTHRFIQESNVPGEKIPNQNQIQDHTLIDYRNNMEKPSFGYSLDLKVGKRLSESWILRGGVSYIKMGNKIEKTSEFDPPQTVSNDSMVVLNVEQNMVQGAASRNYTSEAYNASTNEYVYVTVPVTVQYEKGFGKWRFYMGAGASVDYLISTKTEILDNYSWPIGSDRRLSQLPRLNYNMILNAGLGLEVLPHLTLTGEPTYRGALRSLLPEGSSLQQYPYMIGFSTGLKYEF